ncbi:MAG: hypothetical protein IT451_01925 [Candidatus Brocadia sp.]|nr:hypothetical protein [Candidatus Brocadia sp.]
MRTEIGAMNQRTDTLAATETNITAGRQQKPQISQITQKKLTKKERFYKVNIHEPKAHKRSRRYAILPSSLLSKEEKFPRPL